MNFKPRKWQIITAVILLLFIVLNPSSSDFREYTGIPKENYDVTIHREWNFLVLSVYSTYYYGEDRKYLGIFKNFIRL